MFNAIKKGLFLLGLCTTIVPFSSHANQAIIHQIKAVTLNYKSFPSVTLEDGSYWIFMDPGRFPNLNTGPWKVNDSVWILPYDNAAMLGIMVNINRGNSTTGLLYGPGNTTAITSIANVSGAYQVTLSNGLTFSNETQYNSVCAGWNVGDFVTLCGDADGYFAINTTQETYAKYAN